MKSLSLEQSQKMMERSGGWLDLRGTQITSLPDNLTVGGWLDLSGTQINDKEKARRNVKKLRNGDYVPKRYLYADEILTHTSKPNARLKAMCSIREKFPVKTLYLTERTLRIVALSVRALLI